MSPDNELHTSRRSVLRAAAALGAGCFIQDGGIAPGGPLPVNTHGGFLAYSYRLGIEHVTEAVRQLRHEAGRAQVPDAEIGLVTGLSMPDFGVLLLGR